MISYAKGDATQPIGNGNKVIVHITNDVGAWGAGFVLAVSKRWKEPETLYRADQDRRLGAVQFVHVEQGIVVANMTAQTGLGSASGPPIRYDALRKCLARVAAFASHWSASVHMPRIGCGLAGGHWDKVEPIVLETLGAAEIPIVVYDFEPAHLMRSAS